MIPQKTLVLNVYKPIGYTPLQVIQRLKELHPEYKNEKISYAGRLDPMAHGVMLLLIGEENENRQKYLNLSKTYQFKVIFGIETDSYDILGMIKHTQPENLPTDLETKINGFINESIGKHIKAYPPYSTKTIHGKPLFKWSREGRLSEITIPEREIEIYKFKLINLENISTQEFKTQIISKIESLEGDFRQEEIINKWLKFFDKYPEYNLKIATLEVECSTGTYMRTLAHELGIKIGCGAIAYHILRTNVGQWKLEKSIHLQLDTSDV